MSYTIIQEKTTVSKLQQELGSKSWPEFMQHDEIAVRYWPSLYTLFNNYQFAVLEGDKVVGIGNSIPLFWNSKIENLPEEGFDWAMCKANSDLSEKTKPNTLVALQILINKDFRGKGISAEMINIMKGIAIQNNFDSLALPVRPTLKCNYPNTTIEEYIQWKNDDGNAFDPWIRIHLKMGADLIKICKKSMVIKGTVAEWESWTGMTFPKSGHFIADGALNPIEINLEKNVGIYTEPNVWMAYNLKD